jgi:hypothetical protein
MVSMQHRHASIDICMCKVLKTAHCSMIRRLTVDQDATSVHQHWGESCVHAAVADPYPSHIHKEMANISRECMMVTCVIKMHK